MNEQEALRLEMLDQRIELIFEEMERNHPEFSQEEAELSHIRDEIEQDPLLGPAGKKKMQEYICFLSRMEQRHNTMPPRGITRTLARTASPRRTTSACGMP